MILHGDIPALLATAGRVVSGEHQPRGCSMGEQIGPQLLTPVAAICAIAGLLQLVDQIQIGRRRLTEHTNGLAILFRQQAQGDGFEIHHQRIGSHVVGPRRLRIKVGRVGFRQCKGTAIKHQVTANFAHPTATDLP